MRRTGRSERGKRTNPRGRAAHDDLPPCRWSPRTALDPKHRPQVPFQPSSTVRREWARYPQEAHLLEVEQRRIRRLLPEEIVALQGFGREWFETAAIAPLDWIRAAGDAVPPPLSAALFEAIERQGVTCREGHIEIAAGAGGLATGAAAAGYETLALVDAWPTSARILRAHWPAEVVHVRDVRRFDFSPFRDEVGILAGGPPCQPWSAAGARAGATDPRDLLGEMDQLIGLVRPDAFVFENVPGLVRGRFADYFDTLMRRLSAPTKNLRYGTLAALFNAADFGVPQVRRRVFIVGLRDRTPSDVAKIFEAVHAAGHYKDRWRPVAEVIDPSAGGWMRWWYEDTRATYTGDEEGDDDL